MLDTLSMYGSVRIILSHEGIDQTVIGPNAITTECFNYLLNCMTVGSTTINAINDIVFYYSTGTIESGSIVTTVYKSRPTEKSALFTATIANTIPIKNIYETRLRTANLTTYSSFTLPIITIPSGYTMSVFWTIAYP